jgi:hypothetical protein
MISVRARSGGRIAGSERYAGYRREWATLGANIWAGIKGHWGQLKSTQSRNSQLTQQVKSSKYLLYPPHPRSASL